MIRLEAASKFALFTVSNSAAKPNRLCSAPFSARIVATFWIAPVMVLKARLVLPRDVTVPAVILPIPAVVPLRSRPSMVTADEVLPSSVTGTLRLFVPNRETLLNFSFVSAES